MYKKQFVILLFLVGVVLSVAIAQIIDATIAPPAKGLRNQAVCTVTQNANGEYSKDDCGKIFKTFPRTALCVGSQQPVLEGCIFNKGANNQKEACTNKAGEVGVWCTCYYDCVLPNQVGK